MKIGFDAKRATSNFTGLGNYSRTLILSLQKYYPGDEYLLFTPKLKQKERYEPLFYHPGTRFILPGSWLFKKCSAIWRSFISGRLATAAGVDVFHGLSGELPFFISRKVKAVLTVHDLIFLRYPAYYKFIDRWIYKLKLQYACRRADEIIAISLQTKEDLVSFLGIDPERIRVIYQACDPVFRSPVAIGRKTEVSKKYNLPASFLLSVGTLEKRKNSIMLLEAFNLLPDTFHLVLAGRRTSYTAELEEFISRNKLEERVQLLNSVSFEELPALYQLADIFIYPSVFEGFGIPVEEALFSGVPVITTRGSCFAEAGGPDSIYIEQGDYKSLADAICRLQTDEQKREEMSRNGRIFAENFLPSKLSNELMETYRAVR